MYTKVYDYSLKVNPDTWQSDVNYTTKIPDVIYTYDSQFTLLRFCVTPTLPVSITLSSVDAVWRGFTSDNEPLLVKTKAIIYNGYICVVLPIALAKNVTTGGYSGVKRYEVTLIGNTTNDELLMFGIYEITVVKYGGIEEVRENPDYNDLPPVNTNPMITLLNSAGSVSGGSGSGGSGGSGSSASSGSGGDGANVIKQTDTALAKRVEALEKKEDHDTIYDDTEIKQSIADVGTKVDNLTGKVLALEERPTADTALTERVEALERKGDKDTVYDDTAIKRELNLLNHSIAIKKLYYAYSNDENGTDGSTIYSNVYDPINRQIYQYFGISDTESVNPNDYIWMPGRLASQDKLVNVILDINKLKQDKGTIYDDSKLVKRIENLESEDATIKERIGVLEEKRGNDATTYDDASLKAKIVELESKLQSLNNINRPPYGYRLNRKADPWELIFDNGCVLTFPLDTRHNYYGWNESPISGKSRSSAIYPSSTPEMIMWYVKGHRTADYIKTADVSEYTEYVNCELKNPINDSSLYNFDNAFGDASDATLIGKRNFIKLLYELDAFTEEDLLSVGVTKNEDR